MRTGTAHFVPFSYTEKQIMTVMHVFFMHPLWLLALLLLPLPWLFLKRREYLPHSNVGMLRAKGSGWLRRMPLAAFTVGLALLIVCISRPQVREDAGNQTIMSRDIIVAVDISGSMGAGFEGEIPKLEGGNPELDKQLPLPPKPDPSRGEYRDPSTGHRRIDAAQNAVLRFVRFRFERAAGDRMGIEVFDTQARWSWPLTDDLKMIYRKGLFVDAGLGGGTSLPVAIEAAMAHFDERGQAASKVMILVTDGEDYIPDSTMSSLQSQLKARGVRLYVIGVGEDLARGGADIFRLAKDAGGATFGVRNAAEMAKCFDSIDALERSPVQVQMSPHFRDIFHFFAIAGLLFVCIALVGEAIIVSN
jgi:Ca-activated chloride channel family protein